MINTAYDNLSEKSTSEITDNKKESYELENRSSKEKSKSTKISVSSAFVNDINERVKSSKSMGWDKVSEKTDDETDDEERARTTTTKSKTSTKTDKKSVKSGSVDTGLLTVPRYVSAKSAGIKSRYDYEQSQTYFQRKSFVVTPGIISAGQKSVKTITTEKEETKVPIESKTTAVEESEIYHDEMMLYRMEAMWRRREYQKNLMLLKYPKEYAIAHSIGLIVLGVAAIALQIVTNVNKVGLYHIGSGIWTGIYLIVCAVLSILLVKFRYYLLYITTMIFHMVGVLISFGGLVVVHAISIGIATCSPILLTKCTDTDKDYMGLFVVLLIIGIVCVVLCFLFFVVVNCKMNVCTTHLQFADSDEPEERFDIKNDEKIESKP